MDVCVWEFLELKIEIRVKISGSVDDFYANCLKLASDISQRSR